MSYAMGHGIRHNYVRSSSIGGTLFAAALVLSPAALCLLPAAVVAQTTTRIMIRVVAHDAKIIGSAVGGARITIRDAKTGSLLARGEQQGDTGDTGRLVVEPRARGASVFDTEGAAGFLAELELKGPTQIRIEAEGPLGVADATQRVSRTLLVVPGQHVLGDGIILEMYGFTVEVIEPSTDLTKAGGQEILVRARVTMLCGCPTEPGGLWDSTDYTIEARILREGEVLEKVTLVYAGEASIYEAPITVPESVEGLSLQVLAMDAKKGNFGMFERPFEALGRGQSSD